MDQTKTKGIRKKMNKGNETETMSDQGHCTKQTKSKHRTIPRYSVLKKTE